MGPLFVFTFGFFFYYTLYFMLINHMLKISRRLHAGWPSSRFSHYSIALGNPTASEKLFNVMSNGINKQGGNNWAEIFARLPMPSANINKAATPDKSLWFTQLTKTERRLRRAANLHLCISSIKHIWWSLMSNKLVRLQNLSLALNLTKGMVQGPEKAFMKVAERRSKKKCNSIVGKHTGWQTHTQTHVRKCKKRKKKALAQASD